MATYAVPCCKPAVSKEDFSPFDIGFVYSTTSKASWAEVFFFNNVWQSPLGYIFPASIKATGRHESADTSG